MSSDPGETSQAARRPKQAVVIIHGIGEQVPMDTLRSFVDTVWTTDEGVCDPADPEAFNRAARSWSKPDRISGDFELRRITTNYNRDHVRTDFFEFYWAHLMRETKMAQVIAWVRVLLLRSPKRVPKHLRLGWGLLWVALVTIAALSAVVRWSEPSDVWGRAVVLAMTIAWAGVAGIVVSFVGDAARYLHVRPPNIAVRHAIRTAGVDLLRKLHDSKSYDRIVVVGHSLGSVVAYDILSYFWQECHTELKAPQGGATGAFKALERLAKEGVPDVDAFQEKQAEYFAQLRTQGCPWLVTDLVTLGSPLAHAEVLIARNLADLQERQARRELPTCPPALDAGRFVFRHDGRGPWLPHHAALFAPTRWTNLYFPCRAVVRGDFIGGALAPVFGRGIKDVAVRTSQRLGLFSHTLYWTRPSGAGTARHIQVLRDAVRVCRPVAPP